VSSLPRDTVIGSDFRIERPLGRGGMGVVYAARQISTGRMRAVKVLHERHRFEMGARSRFEREAWVAAEADAEHLVKVIAAGIDGATGLPWIAMELLEGTDLAELVRTGGPLEPERGIETLAQLCQGLVALHEAGVVHRDVKPSNIFVVHRAGPGAASWRIKLLDLGIAKLAASIGDITQPVGSPAWMAPEQLDPRGLVSARTDLWAVGLVGFWVFTGKVFWLNAHDPEASVHALVGELLGLPIPLASERAAELGGRAPPSWFDGWFARCVAREAAMRFPSAHAAAAALGREEASWPAAVESELVRETVRHPRPALAGGAEGAREGGPPATSDGDRTAETQLLPGDDVTVPRGSATPPPSAASPPAKSPARSGGRLALAALAVLGATAGLATAYALYDHHFNGAGGPELSEQTPAARDVDPCGVVGAACCAGATCEDQLACRDGKCTGCVNRVFAGNHAFMTCAVRADGATYCWGANESPKLISRDAPSAVPTPHRIAALVDPTDMNIADSVVMAVMRGKLIGWGRNRTAELIGHAGHRDVMPDDGGLVMPLEGVDKVSISEWGSVCTVARGGVWCWGANSLGQAGKEPSILEGEPRKVELPAGHGHPRDVQQSDLGMVCALLQGGAWSCWGNWAPWQANVRFTPTSDGRLQSDAPVSTPDLRVDADQLALAGRGSVCVRSGNGVKCFGNDDYCQVGLPATPDAEPTTASPRGVPASVSIVGRKLPADLEQAGVIDIRAGGHHFCVIDGGGRVWCWGRSHRGQAGVPGGHTSMTCEPTLIPLEGKTTALALGFSHTCALSEHGQVFCLGNDDRGQLGRGAAGDFDSTPAPALIPCD
jgi:hypothetical protein